MVEVNAAQSGTNTVNNNGGANNQPNYIVDEESFENTYDTDGDGVVTKQEYGDKQKAINDENNKGKSKIFNFGNKSSKIGKSADVNKDGNITEGEQMWKNASTTDVQKHTFGKGHVWERTTTTRTQYVSKEDFNSYTLDSAKENMSFDEFQKLQYNQYRTFNALDKDGDGKLSQEEAVAYDSSSINEGVGGVYEDVSNLNTTVGSLNQEVGDLSEDVGELNTEVDEISQTVSELSASNLTASAEQPEETEEPIIEDEEINITA